MYHRLIVLSLLALVASAADSPPLTALQSLQPGRWTLTSRDGGFATRSICIGDARVLLQLHEPTAACSRFVIVNEPSTVTVHYTCPGAGHGHTTIRVETPRLAQVQTQGITGHAPFDFSVEARRVSECPTTVSLR